MDILTDLPKTSDGCFDLNAIGRTALQQLVNEIMDEQVTELCAATGVSRNGFRERKLSTCIGDIVLRVPKLREGTYFPEDIVKRWSRTDTALASTITDMWVGGVSNRDAEAIAADLGTENMSRSRVSRLCKSLDSEIEAMTQGDLSDRKWPYLWLDATYVKCREGGASRSTAVVVAIAADEQAKRRVVHIDCIDTESYVAWRDFLLELRKRGMSGVRLVVSDDHQGLVRAVRECPIGSSWQRCIVHLERNVMDRAKKKNVGAAAIQALKAVFAENYPRLVKAGFDRACELLREHDEAGAELLEKAKPDALCYLDFPKEHRK